METIFIRKMVKNCFRQYRTEEDALPITEEEIEEMCEKIMKLKEKEPNIDLFEMINDFVYEYISH